MARYLQSVAQTIFGGWQNGEIWHRDYVSMSRDQITVGVMLRVLAPHWDRRVGTSARVAETGVLFVGNQWCFTVQRTVTLVNEAVRRRVRAYVLVNNRAEGNAPLTVQALVDRLRERDDTGLDHGNIDLNLHEREALASLCAETTLPGKQRSEGVLYV